METHVISAFEVKVMKLFVNILLCVCAAACAAALILQGFLFPALPEWADLLLRFGTGFFSQILLLRLTQKKLMRRLPLLLSGAAAVWGFFLLLTSPSWRGATTAGFLHDYVSFFGGCLLVCFFARIRPWLKRQKRGFADISSVEESTDK